MEVVLGQKSVVVNLRGVTLLLKAMLFLPCCSLLEQTAHKKAAFWRLFVYFNFIN